MDVVNTASFAPLRDVPRADVRGCAPATTVRARVGHRSSPGSTRCRGPRCPVVHEMSGQARLVPGPDADLPDLRGGHGEKG